LQVHPVLRHQGLNGPFAVHLKRLVLQYAGGENLTRLTFMTVAGASVFWVFGGFDIDSEGEIIPIRIPRLGESAVQQSFINASSAGDDFVKSKLLPAPSQGERWDLFLKGKKLLQNAVGEEEILTALKAAYSAENPKRHSSGTMDCVSCHVAQAAVDFGQRNFPALSLPLFEQEAYANAGFNMSQSGSGMGGSERPWHSRNLRAFGYFETTPAISRRAINESAEAARRLNSISPVRIGEAREYRRPGLSPPSMPTEDRGAIPVR